MIYFLIFTAVILRFVPHPANFAPITALALFGGVYLKDKHWAAILPLAAMIVSDIFIGFDSWQSRATVYGAFILSGLIGLAVRRHKNAGTVLGGTLLASVTFYLITNFAFFYPIGMYTHDLNGIIASYINALPFFRNTLLGDLFYVGALFGAAELALVWQRKRSCPGPDRY